MSHYALAVEEEDYGAIVDSLRGHGLEVTEDDFGHSRAVYVTDLDGHVVEFWTGNVGGMYTPAS
jgi:catechol-2,3-dioxygenase